jgi:hypothetical protein
MAAPAYLAFLCGFLPVPRPHNLKDNRYSVEIMELNSCVRVDNACPHSRPFAGSGDR